MNRHEPLVELVRGDLVESIHYGTIAVLAPGDELVGSLGDAAAQMYPRSASKLLQAAAMVELGLDLPLNQLALVASSHSGGEPHVEGVSAILNSYGLAESALQCTAGMPIGSAERKAYQQTGGTPTALRSDCSGKHAGFLATCLLQNWPIDNYLDAAHPLQQAMAAAVERWTGEPIRHTTADGCGAPLFSTTTRGLARAFQQAVTAPAGSPLRQVADAMRAYPELVGGPGREPTAAMQLLPGVLAKDGADGVLALANADGRAIAFKISDGSKRALAPVAIAALRGWGASAAALADFPLSQVLGGGKPVGYLRPSQQLTDMLGAC